MEEDKFKTRPRSVFNPSFDLTQGLNSPRRAANLNGLSASTNNMVLGTSKKLSSEVKEKRSNSGVSQPQDEKLEEALKEAREWKQKYEEASKEASEWKEKYDQTKVRSLLPIYFSQLFKKLKKFHGVGTTDEGTKTSRGEQEDD